MSNIKATIKGVFADRFDTVLGKIVVGMAVLAGFGIFVMGILVVMGVVMRYFFKTPIAWTIEWSEYLLFVNVMLASPYVLKIDQHIRVDIVTMYLKGRIRRSLTQLISVLGVLMCSALFYFSLKTTIADIISGVRLVRIVPVPRWIFMIFFPIMTLLCVFVFIRKIIIFAKNKDMIADCDYQEYEESFMDPRYNLHVALAMKATCTAEPSEQPSPEQADISEVSKT